MSAAAAATSPIERCTRRLKYHETASAARTEASSARETDRTSAEAKASST
jgi:hypothetical protein